MHPWWSLFSQNESLKLENYVKVDSSTELLWKTYVNLNIELPFCKKTYGCNAPSFINPSAPSQIRARPC